MTERQPYTFDRVIRILFGAVFVVGLFYLIYILRGALLPFLVAWIVAYMLNPLVVYNKRVFKLKGGSLPLRSPSWRCSSRWPCWLCCVAVDYRRDRGHAQVVE